MHALAERYGMKQIFPASQMCKTQSFSEGEIVPWQCAPATATDSVEGYCRGSLMSYRNRRSTAGPADSLGCHWNHPWEYVGDEEYYDANQDREYDTV